MKRLFLFFFAVLILGAACPRVVAVPWPSDGEAYVYPSPSDPLHCAKIVYAMRAPGTADIRVYHEDGTLAAHLEEHHGFGLQVDLLRSCSFAPGVYLYRLTLRYDSGLVEKLGSGWFTVSP